MGNSRLQPAVLPQFCDEGPKLQLVTELFCVWMRYHFGSTDTIIDTRLHEKIWRPEIQTAGIVIESSTVWDPRITQFRPSIVVKRQAWQNIRIGIDHRYMGEPSIDGHEHYTNFWQGAHSLMVVAGEAGETEILADEVFHELNQMGRAVRSQTGMHKLEVVEVGDLSKLKEAKEAFVIPVNIAYVIETNWRLAVEAPFFKRLSMSISQGG